MHNAHNAANRGQSEMVLELIRNGAAANGQSKMVSNLIKNGAKDDFAAGTNAPLHNAAIGGHLQMATVLLDEGCNISAVDENG